MRGVAAMLYRIPPQTGNICQKRGIKKSIPYRSVRGTINQRARVLIVRPNPKGVAATSGQFPSHLKLRCARFRCLFERDERVFRGKTGNPAVSKELPTFTFLAILVRTRAIVRDRSSPIRRAEFPPSNAECWFS